MRAIILANSRSDVSISLREPPSDPLPRRLSTRRILQQPVFGLSPKFSSSTARLVVVLCVTWFFLCLCNHFVQVHGVSARRTAEQPPPPYLSPGEAHPDHEAYYPEHAVNPLARPPEGGGALHSQPSALSAQIADRQNTRFASLHASMHSEQAGAANEAPQSSHRYPLNLHRIYVGQWKVAAGDSAPFHAVPVAVNPASRRVDNRPMSAGMDSTAHGLVNAVKNSTSEVYVEKKFSFTSRSGFAVVPLENHPTGFDSLNIVAGSMLFRDGPYRSEQDMTVPLVGVYEWKTGLIVAVSDAHVDERETVLKRLYKDFLANRKPGQAEEEQIVEDKFVAQFRLEYLKYAKASSVQRPVTEREPSVASQCPFTVVFNVKQDMYMDKPPQALECGALGPPGYQDEMVEGGRCESVGDNLRYSEVARNRELTGDLEHVRRSTFAHRPSSRSSMSQEQGTGQEEMVKMRGVFVSKQCKTKMSLELSTLDIETLFAKVIKYTLLVTVVAFTQVIVLIRQMAMTATQLDASRVSLMTVGLQAMADSFLCLGHLTLGIAVPTLFNAFAATAFFKFICFLICMLWMWLTWKARRPSGFSGYGDLCLMYFGFFVSLLVGLFLLYQLQENLRIFIFALYSFWVPQILLNIVEDHRRPLLPMYIIGTSITRLAIPLYFWACPKNFYGFQPLPLTATALVGWMGAQALILLSQYKFGARWFIPEALLPKKYRKRETELLLEANQHDLQTYQTFRV